MPKQLLLGDLIFVNIFGFCLNNIKCLLHERQLGIQELSEHSSALFSNVVYIQHISL